MAISRLRPAWWVFGVLPLALGCNAILGIQQLADDDGGTVDGTAGPDSAGERDAAPLPDSPAAEEGASASDAAAESPAKNGDAAPADGPSTINEADVVEAGCPPPTTLECGGLCVDPSLPAHCGTCGNVCAGPGSMQGQATCSVNGASGADGGGPCGITCNPGYHLCSGDCLSNTNDPHDDPCVVSDATGVFVATTGSDTTGQGTMERAYATVSKGIAQAIGGTKRVYVCLGTYGEQLSIGASADGLKVYGGLDCTKGWKYVGNSSTAATLVASPAAAAAPGTALTVTGPMTAGVTFEDVNFASPDETGAGASSVAVFATTSAKVTLMRGSVTAGKAGNGTSGGDECELAWHIAGSGCAKRHNGRLRRHKHLRRWHDLDGRGGWRSVVGDAMGRRYQWQFRSRSLLACEQWRCGRRQYLHDRGGWECRPDANCGGQRSNERRQPF
jgi:hypothetical protein